MAALTASADFVIYEGSSVFYSVTDIKVDYEYDALNQSFRVKIVPIGALVGLFQPELGSEVITLDSSDVIAKEGGSSGTYYYERLHHCIVQCVDDYLEAITENSAVTFTIV